jgi:hypothetical protein
VDNKGSCEPILVIVDIEAILEVSSKANGTWYIDIDILHQF